MGTSKAENNSLIRAEAQDAQNKITQKVKRLRHRSWEADVTTGFDFTTI